IPGLSVAVVQDQKLVWAAGSGFADIEARTPATEHTTYRIASLTKTFASTLAQRQVERGKLDLDAPMSRYSPDFKDDAVKVRHVLVKAETQRLAWTPAKNAGGGVLPYGLGRFVQDYRGEPLVWHYGQWPTFSALYLKVPGRKMTFLALANSTGLSAPFRLGAGDVLTSPFALAFLRAFAGEAKEPPPAPPWRLGAA